MMSDEDDVMVDFDGGSLPLRFILSFENKFKELKSEIEASRRLINSNYAEFSNYIKSNPNQNPSYEEMLTEIDSLRRLVNSNYVDFANFANSTPTSLGDTDFIDERLMALEDQVYRIKTQLNEKKE